MVGLILFESYVNVNIFVFFVKLFSGRTLKPNWRQIAYSWIIR